ncbi:MAG: hypothetical protein GY884_05565 [Proteobacteria bacterium]|nr:hypothetical protein [Pseudomonadota bacterium]
MRLRLPLAALVAFALACTGGGGDDDPVGDPGGGDTASSSEQAPQILEFTANPMTVSDGADATFCALVTDPQGIDDLIGGSLKANGATLAAFSGAADEGSYSATVGFTALSEAYDVDADGQSGTLTVTASFSDQTGNTSTQDLELELELTCDGGDHLCTDVARD